MKIENKVVVIGWDGATWELLKPWADSGFLPNLQRLMKEGVWGELESTIPPVTIPAWITFSTGKNPGKHGCYDFITPQSDLTDLKVVSINQIRTRTIYEILEQQGKKSILINLPGYFPPRIKNGTVIASFLYPKDDFYFPADLKESLPELAAYQREPQTTLILSKGMAEFIASVREIENVRFKVSQKLFSHDWALFFVLFAGIDWIQHHIYSEILSETDSPTVKEARLLFQDLDSYLGFFLENLPPNCRLFLMSDHGFQGNKGKFLINEWLRRKGYLETEISSIPKVYYAKHLKAEDRQKEGKRFQFTVPEFILKNLKFFSFPLWIYRQLKRFLPFKPGVQRTPKLKQTRAFAIGNPGLLIYLNRKDRFKNGVVEEKDYLPLREEIVSQLLQLNSELKGEKILERVWQREEIYQGEYLADAPDIVLQPGKFYIVDAFRDKSYLWDIKGKPADCHSSQGIFAAWGEGIKKGAKISGAEICDLAPTILDLMGIPLPRDLDGKVLKSIFAPDSESAQKEVVYQSKAREQLEQKLRQLKSKTLLG